MKGIKKKGQTVYTTYEFYNAHLIECIVKTVRKDGIVIAESEKGTLYTGAHLSFLSVDEYNKLYKTINQSIENNSK